MLLKPYQDLARIKSDTAKAPEQIDKALEKIPAATETIASIENVLSRLRSVVALGKAKREETFRRVEAEFIRTRRQEVSVRELDQGWRVGHLELAVNRILGKARVLFNREVVVDWSFVATVQDFEQIIAVADS